MLPYTQAEFHMTLPDMGLLQSAALVGYLLGQVLPSIQKPSSTLCRNIHWSATRLALHARHVLHQCLKATEEAAQAKHVMHLGPCDLCWQTLP